MPPTEVTTRRLTLRPLRRNDLDHPEVVRWHTDPEGYVLMAEEPYASSADFRDAAEHWVLGWEDGGPSYWLALDRASGEPIGLGGVRRLEFGGQEYVNLYYRLAPAARGRRLGREIAMAGVAWCREWWPGLQIIARVAPRNAPSLAVIRRVGMRQVGTWRSPHDPVDQHDSILFTAPAVLTGAPDEAGREEMRTLWEAVNAAGGAVGFDGAAPRADVEAALAVHLDQLAAGSTELVRIVEPTMDTWDDPTDHGALLGFGFTRRLTGPAAHRANLERVMVDPATQGSGLGRVLLADLHACARTRGVEMATIAYPGGTGLGDFYAGAGYREVGRVPGGLRFSGVGDQVRYLDDVTMAYRTDGEIL